MQHARWLCLGAVLVSAGACVDDGDVPEGFMGSEGSSSAGSGGASGEGASSSSAGSDSGGSATSGTATGADSASGGSASGSGSGASSTAGGGASSGASSGEDSTGGEATSCHLACEAIDACAPASYAVIGLAYDDLEGCVQVCAAQAVAFSTVGCEVEFAAMQACLVGLECDDVVAFLVHPALAGVCTAEVTAATVCAP